MIFPFSGRFVVCAALVSAFLIPAVSLHGQAADPAGASAASDAEQRLKWLNARVPPKSTASANPKVGFRSNPKAVSTRPVESPPAEPRPAEPSSTRSASVEKRAADAPSEKPAPAKAPDSKPIAGESRAAKSTPPPIAKASPTPIAKPTPTAVAAESSSAKSRTAKTKPLAKASPTPAAKSTPPAVAAESASAKSRSAKSTPAPKATPAQVAKLTSGTLLSESAPAKAPASEARATPAPKATPPPSIAAGPSIRTSEPKPQLRGTSSGSTGSRYPWKSGIVTTVFWIGEPVGGNNFTPNCSSSWDANWTQSYGGFDTPDPARRRNFIPVKFTPRQNPFYVALPYNDVTRGTTKPEARRVIPWFKDAFEREGQSVCRDRWVAIRSRSGKVAYAQWSDCGPFRTDHWEYVFGSERPRPNLNKGAGLDVSPAVRDFLGIDSTDVTDWKFVDFKDVPGGPWARYGQNNSFVMKTSRPPKSAAKPSARTAENSRRDRVRDL